MKFSQPPADTESVNFAACTPLDCRERALKSLERLPPFSPVLNRVLASIVRDDVSLAELAGLIEKDTVLAGNVLRLVNSALYGLKGSVNSVRHAVAIIGLLKLRNVLLGMSVSRLWRNVRTPPGWYPATFNLHSVAVAILADMLVEVAPVEYAEGAFVAGLLHDVGKLLVAIGLPREYALLRRLLEAGECSWVECDRRIIGTDHAELSAEVLKRWELPVAIQCAVRFHHAPELANQGKPHLAHVVHAANLLATDLGYSMLPPGVEPLRDSSLAIAMLGASEALPHLVERFRAEFEVVRELFC